MGADVTGGALTSLRDHPGAGPAIRRAKGIGGLGGFAVAMLIGLENGTPFASTMERALAVGLGSNLIVWAAAVLIWKRLLVAQAAGLARARRREAPDGGNAE
jgi:hypothetical protein